MIQTTPNLTHLINIIKEIRRSDSKVTNLTLAQQLHITETTLRYITSYRQIPTKKQSLALKQYIQDYIKNIQL